MIDSGAFLCQVKAVRNSAFSKAVLQHSLVPWRFFLLSLTTRRKSAWGKVGERPQLVLSYCRSRLVLGSFSARSSWWRHRAKVDSRGELIKLLHEELLFSVSKTMVTLVSFIKLTPVLAKLQHLGTKLATGNFWKCWHNG